MSDPDPVELARQAGFEPGRPVVVDALVVEQAARLLEVLDGLFAVRRLPVGRVRQAQARRHGWSGTTDADWLAMTQAATAGCIGELRRALGGGGQRPPAGDRSPLPPRPPSMAPGVAATEPHGSRE